MQPGDPPPQPPEDLPPLVRRPEDFQVPALVLPAPPEFVPLVLPVRSRPPDPGFWMACLWCLVFFLFINGVAVFGAVAALAEELLPYLLRNEKIGPEILGNGKKIEDSPLFVHVMERAMGAAEVGSVIFALLVVRLMVGRDWKQQLGLVRPRLIHIILVVLGTPAMMVVGDLAYTAAEALFRAIHMPTFKDLGLGGMQQTMDVVAQWPWWFSVLVIGVGPGIGEELWCRGFLGRGLVGRYGFFAGVIITSIFFGLLHVDPPHVAAACAMGFLLHYVYLTTRCLWLSMLLHFLNNSVGAVAVNKGVLRQVPMLKDLDKLEPSWQFLGAVLFLLAAVIWALYVSRTRLAAVGGGPPPWQPAYSGAAAPPEGSGTVETIPRFAWLAVLPALAGAGAVAAAVYLVLQGKI